MMKIISWNVNGLRACIKKGFLEYFNGTDADIFCVQETKMQEEQIAFETPLYIRYFNSAVKKGYSGTAVFTKQPPVRVEYGIDGSHNDEGRVILLDFNSFYLVTCYTPNSQRELFRLDYRMKFEDDLREYLTRLKKEKPVILCGDLNVAHNEIDLRHPKPNIGNAGFSYEEREKFGALLNAGFTDSFRYLYPDRKDAYTWWSYRMNVREKNVGWRIDYFVVSDDLKDGIVDSRIESDVFGSDHCPVCLEIEIKQRSGKGTEK